MAEKKKSPVIIVSGKVEIIKDLMNKNSKAKPFIYLDPPYYPIAIKSVNNLMEKKDG